VVVPVGRTVYFETPAKVFGHVALSLGDGRCISQTRPTSTTGVREGRVLDAAAPLSSTRPSSEH